MIFDPYCAVQITAEQYLNYDIGIMAAKSGYGSTYWYIACRCSSSARALQWLIIALNDVGVFNFVLSTFICCFSAPDRCQTVIYIAVNKFTNRLSIKLGSVGFVSIDVHLKSIAMTYPN